MEDSAKRLVRVWDWPVRIVHWAFVLLMPGLWWTAEEGDLTIHKELGYIMLALLLFRLIWGVIGSSTARFAHFVKGPTVIFGYIRTLFHRKEASQTAGHNPLGALSVLALLLLLVVQAGSGLFAQDVDGIESGPLSYLVSYDSADAARDWHHMLFDCLLVLIAIHLAAILFYLFYKRDNLISPMINGKKEANSSTVDFTSTPLWHVTVVVTFSIGCAWWISKGMPLF